MQHSPRHFLTLNDLSRDEALALLERARELKRLRQAGEPHASLRGKTLIMVFEKPSTRTRVSFEAAMLELGGHAVFLSAHDSQIGRGEPPEDSARVLSRMGDIIMIRTFEQARLETFAQHSRAPVINGLTDLHHPCQALADMLTWLERRGRLDGGRAAWIGDGNNMCNSYIEAAGLFDFELRVACPPAYRPALKPAAGARVAIGDDPRAAVEDADLVVTDVWTSMGQEEENRQRRQDFADYQVDAALMQRAKPDALFMHCLPAHRGEEVTAEVLDGPHSVVWDEAENRLHAQKALLEFLLGGRG